MSTGNVLDLEKRRTEKLESALLKLENILDHTKMYKMTKNTEKMKLIIKDLNKNVKTKNMSGLGKYHYFKFIDIKAEHSAKFTTSLIDKVFKIYSDIIYKEVSDKEDEFKTYLQYAESNYDKYKTSIRNLVELVEQDRNNFLEKEIFEIEKDLISCLSYNDKIEKEKKYEMVGV